MGMFDFVYAKMKCPDCRSEEVRDIQTKAFQCSLTDYRIGDLPEEAPVGDVWVEGVWGCQACEKANPDVEGHTAFIHVVDGLIVSVAPERHLDDRQNSEELYRRALRAAAERALHYRLALQRLYLTIVRTQEAWKEDRVKKAPPHPDLKKFLGPGPKSEKELLQEVRDLLEKDLEDADKQAALWW